VRSRRRSAYRRRRRPSHDQPKRIYGRAARMLDDRPRRNRLGRGESTAAGDPTTAAWRLTLETNDLGAGVGVGSVQFYLKGYKRGDPWAEARDSLVPARTGVLRDAADVLIIGCGPAGLVLAAQMANFPDITTAVIDRRDGPIEVGQADGVACRT